MATWQEFTAADAEFAEDVHRCFTVRKHATMATLRRDGSPRISGTEVEFGDDGEIYLGMMPGSLKALDLRRDDRLALHSPTTDPTDTDPSRSDEPHRFRIDVTEVVLTTVAPTGDHLLIRSWHPGRGVEERARH